MVKIFTVTLLLLLAFTFQASAQRLGPTVIKAEKARHVELSKLLAPATTGEEESGYQCELCGCRIWSHSWLCAYVGQVWFDCKIHPFQPCTFKELAY